MSFWDQGHTDTTFYVNNYSIKYYWTLNDFFHKLLKVVVTWLIISVRREGYTRDNDAESSISQMLNIAIPPNQILLYFKKFIR